MAQSRSNIISMFESKKGSVGGDLVEWNVKILLLVDQSNSGCWIIKSMAGWLNQISCFMLA